MNEDDQVLLRIACETALAKKLWMHGFDSQLTLSRPNLLPKKKFLAPHPSKEIIWLFKTKPFKRNSKRLLPIEGANDLFYQPPPPMPTSKVYAIRPYFPKDEASVYKICKEMYDDEMDGDTMSDQPDIIGDSLVGGLLTLSPDYCFVLEDEGSICGYALGTVDVKPYARKCKVSWIPAMREKYVKPEANKELSEEQKMMLSFHEEQQGLPENFLATFPSLIKVDVHSKVTDPSVAKSMMGCLLSSLKANGSRGAFCEVKPNDRRGLEFYSKLGFLELAKMEGFPKEMLVLGRNL